MKNEISTTTSIPHDYKTALARAKSAAKESGVTFYAAAHDGTIWINETQQWMSAEQISAYVQSLAE